MSTRTPRTVIVLAAGEGKRMRSSLPKVLHPLLGRSLLGHVLAAAEGLGADRTLVVVGSGAAQVTDHLAEVAPKAVPVHQGTPLGTGHAVRAAMERTGAVTGTVVVLNGDLPMLRAATLRDLLERHESRGAAATLLTAVVEDPSGLGRVRRDPDGAFAGIVEERDATEAQRALREVNAGCYAFAAEPLREALGRLGRDNAQAEEYLTDVPAMLLAAGATVTAHRAADPAEAMGCNDRAELARVRARLRDRVNDGWLREGVTIVDPATTWIDVTVSLGRDAVVEPHTQLRGTSTVGERATVGPEVTLIDAEVGVGAAVVRSHVVGAEIGPGASVGPYAYLRPGTKLHRGAKVGTFVETKQSEIGEAAKVPHLAYVGNATVGGHANLGAGTIVANYDGVAKHHTEIGEAVFVGSNSCLVAPVTVADGAYIAAGSVVTTPVPAGALGVTRAAQRNLDGWVVRRREGTRSAAAAQRAAGREDQPEGTAGDR